MQLYIGPLAGIEPATMSTPSPPPPLTNKDINSLLCGRDIDQHNTSCRRYLKFEKPK